MTGTGEAVLFWILGPLAVVGALGLVFARKAVHAAIGMAMTMIILGVFYIAQDADFLGVIQIFVYTGAVMMLFLFVLMLVGVDSSDSLVETLTGQRWATVAAQHRARPASSPRRIGEATFGDPVGVAAINAETGNVSAVAQLIFGRYVWVFEMTSALLITAALGAMVLAHRERLGPRPEPARVEQAPLPRGRAPRRPAGARRLRPAQRRRHPGPAARRHAVGAVGLARAHGPRPEPLPGGLPRGRGPDRTRHAGGERPVSVVNYIYLATILFAIGGATVLTRRNAIIVFMGVELMLNATNLVFVTFARIHGNLDGQVIALFVMVVAAAEVVVGLAIIMAIFRSRRSASVDDANLLKL